MQRKLTSQRLPLSFLVLILLTASLSGCAAKQVTAPHPNQINALDGQAYDALTEAQTAISTAKEHFNKGDFPASSKPVLNGAIAAYNSAQQSWHTYRAIINGQQTGDASAVGTELANLINQLNTSISQLRSLGGH